MAPGARSGGRRRAVLAASAAWVLLVAPVAAASAGSGKLDPSFGGNGKVTTTFVAGASATDAAIQPDGRIVVAGAAGGEQASGVFALARYEPDGSLDPTFGIGGRVTTAITAGGDEAQAVAIQLDGRIVAAGTAGLHRFALARYGPDGALDPTFGDGGIVRTDFTLGYDLAYDVAVQPNGRIVAAGSAGTRRPAFALARYLPDGSLDPAFGGDGKVKTTYGIWGVAHAMAIQPNGKIVVAGTNGRGFALARYRADGGLDPSFGGDGKVGNSFPQGWANAIALQDDGRIVVGGALDIFSFALARYTSRGRLDRTFGRDGRVVTHVGGGEQMVVGLVIRRGGKILAAGRAGPHESMDPTVWRFVLTRYRANGGLDRKFGRDGRLVTRFKGGALALGATAQPDGRVIVVGGAGKGNAEAFALARYAV